MMDNLERVKKIRALCLVLGINPEEKFGAEENLQDEKADEILASLSITKFSRFTKAKLLLKHIFKYWDLLSIGSEEKMKFSYIFCFVYCAQHDEVTEANVLGLNVLQEMEDELAKLKDACNTKIANKVKQLDAYMQLSHLDIEKFPCTPANANVDPSARLNEIKNVIRSVKRIVSKRSAIVTMTEFVLSAVQEVKWFKNYDECDRAIADVTHPFHERTIKAERLSCTIEGLLKSLKPKVNLLETINVLEHEYREEHPPRSVEFPVPLRVVPPAADEVDGHADSRSLHVSPAADEVDEESRPPHVSTAAEVAESIPLSVSPYSPVIVEGAASSPSSYVSSPYQPDPNDSDYVP